MFDDQSHHRCVGTITAVKMDKKSRELVMAKLYLKNKDYKMAEKSFTDYLNMYPDDVNALKLLAQVFEQNKRFDKAYEMYERCYLSEPDRAGVLLDICRILLIDEVWFEGMDYRKWLNLAQKAFPGNPLVTNLKSLVATLPTDEQPSGKQREIPSKQDSNFNSRSSHGPSEELLHKVLEKLTLMEKRLEKIETKISDSNTNILKAQQQPQTRFDQQSPVRTDPQVTTRVETQTPKQAEPQIPTRIEQKTPAKPEQQSQAKANPEPVSSPMQVPSFSNFSSSLSGNLFADGLKKFDIPKTFGSPQVPPAPTNNFPKNESSSIFGEGLKKFDLSNAFSFSQPLNLTNDQPSTEAGNLFSESLKKFNVPSTFSFSQAPPTSTNSLSISSPWGNNDKKQDNKESDTQDEVVPNEELPIEQTCDMTPIAYKTGEEDEDVIFESRCKLYRFRDKEYKERGLGDIKVMRHKRTGKGRLVMRREAIGLVCLNCWDCHSISKATVNQIKFSGLDASDESVQATLFLAKFKLESTAVEFKGHLESLFSNEGNSFDNGSNLFKNESSATNNDAEVELVDPKINNELVNKARELKLPDLFYHDVKNQQPPCNGCDGCKEED